MSKRRRAQGTGGVYYDASRKRWIGEVTIGGHRRRVVVPGNKSDKMAAGEAKRKLREMIEAPTASAPAGAPGKGGTVADAVAVFLERDLPARRRGGRPLAPASITGYRWACAHISQHL